MFRRAGISFVLAVVAGLPLFLDLDAQWEVGFKVACGVSFAFSVISFLFGMFEEEEQPHPVPARQPKLETLGLDRLELIRVAP